MGSQLSASDFETNPQADADRQTTAPLPEVGRAPDLVPADTPVAPSSWWTAPAGRPVDIPAFGYTSLRMKMHNVRRNWLEKLWDLLMPKPIGRPELIPVKVRAGKR